MGSGNHQKHAADAHSYNHKQLYWLVLTEDATHNSILCTYCDTLLHSHTPIYRVLQMILQQCLVAVQMSNAGLSGGGVMLDNSVTGSEGYADVGRFYNDGDVEPAEVQEDL